MEEIIHKFVGKFCAVHSTSTASKRPPELVNFCEVLLDEGASLGEWGQVLQTYFVLLCQTDSVATTESQLLEYCANVPPLQLQGESSSSRDAAPLRAALLYDWAEIRKLVYNPLGGVSQEIIRLFDQTDLSSETWINSKIPSAGTVWTDFSNRLKRLKGSGSGKLGDMFKLLLNDKKELAELYNDNKIDVLHYVYARFRSSYIDGRDPAGMYVKSFLSDLEDIKLTKLKACFGGDPSTIVQYIYEEFHDLRPKSLNRGDFMAKRVISRFVAGYTGDYLIQKAKVPLKDSTFPDLVEDIFIQSLEQISGCLLKCGNYLLVFSLLDLAKAQNWIRNDARRVAFVTDMISRLSLDSRLPQCQHEFMQLMKDRKKISSVGNVVFDIAAIAPFQNSSLFGKIAEVKQQILNQQPQANAIQASPLTQQPKTDPISLALRIYKINMRGLSHLSEQRINLIFEWCIFIFAKELFAKDLLTIDNAGATKAYQPYFPMPPACLGTTSIKYNANESLSYSDVPSSPGNLESIASEAADIIAVFYDDFRDETSDFKFKAEYKCLMYLSEVNNIYTEANRMSADKLYLESLKIELIEKIIDSIGKVEVPVRFWSILVSLVCLINNDLIVNSGYWPQGWLSSEEAFLLIQSIEKPGNSANCESLPKVSTKVRELALSFVQHGVIFENKKYRRMCIVSEERGDKKMYCILKDDLSANLKAQIKDYFRVDPELQRLEIQVGNNREEVRDVIKQSIGRNRDPISKIFLKIIPKQANRASLADQYFLSAF